MKRSLILVAVASLVFAGMASAEVKKGDMMLDFLAGYTQQNFSEDVGGGDISVLFGAIRPGYALSDNIRAAALGAVAHISNGSDTTVWSVGASGEYVFMPANQLNFLLGGFVAYADADSDAGDADGITYGPRAGFLYTLNTTNNLFGEFWWQFYSGDIGDALDDGFLFIFGIEHKFKVGQ